MSDQDFYLKYLKYKSKYFNLKTAMSSNQSGGSMTTSNKMDSKNPSGDDKVEIYLFKADWCGHCKGFKPTWEKIKKDLGNKYNFITVDADKDKPLIEKWKIQGFPTIIKKVGDKAEEYVGPRDEQSVVDFIKAN